MRLTHPENRCLAQFPRIAHGHKRVAGAEPTALAQFVRYSLGNDLAGFDGTVRGDVRGLEADGRGCSPFVGHIFDLTGLTALPALALCDRCTG